MISRLAATYSLTDSPLPSGDIEFLGRMDHQVKIRGYRVELGEIEAVLSQCAAVREAVVIARDDTHSGKRLVAYVIPADKAACTPQALKDFLKTRLPDYMLPAAFVTLDALPLTPNGKVDRRNLPSPDGAALLAAHCEPPAGPVERTLAEIWREVLGVQQIGRNDNFFDLGGNSLQATQVILRVRTKFRLELPMRHLFEAPTLAGLAEVIGQRQWESHDPDEVARLIAEVETLSDDEAARHLAQVSDQPASSQ